MALNVVKIRASENATREANAIVDNSLNRNAFKELDNNDPSDDSKSADAYGSFRVQTNAGTFDVDSGTVGNPYAIQLNRYTYDTSGGATPQTHMSGLLIKEPLLPGEEIEISFYTAKTGQTFTQASGEGKNDDFIGVYYQDTESQWDTFSSTPMGGYGSGTGLTGKGIVPASTSTNLGVTNGGFQYSSGRSNSSFSQARNSNNSSNQTNGKLYTYNLPAHGTSTALSRFFRVTIKNNSVKAAMLKFLLINETEGSPNYIYANFYDMRIKVTYPSGGIVNNDKGGILGATSGNGGNDHNLTVGGRQLIVSNPNFMLNKNKNKALVHSEFILGHAPASSATISKLVNTQYFIHNYSKGDNASDPDLEANYVYIASLANNKSGAPTCIRQGSTDQNWTFKSPDIIIAPKSGKFIKTRFCTDATMSGTVTLHAKSITHANHKELWGDTKSGQSPATMNVNAAGTINGVNGQVFEFDWSAHNLSFNAGDAIWVTFMLPDAAWIINGYTIIEWT